MQVCVELTLTKVFQSSSLNWETSWCSKFRIQIDFNLILAESMKAKNEFWAVTTWLSSFCLKSSCQWRLWWVITDQWWLSCSVIIAAYAQVFRIKLPSGARERGRLIHRRDINQVFFAVIDVYDDYLCCQWWPRRWWRWCSLQIAIPQVDYGHMSLNCIRSGQSFLFLLVDPYFTSCRFHWWARHSTTSSMLFVIGVIIFSATIFIFITVVMKWAPRSASSSLFSSRLAVSCLRPAKNPRSQKSSFNPKYSRIAFAFHQINLVCPPFTAAGGPGHIPQNLTAHRDFDQIRWLR